MLFTESPSVSGFSGLVPSVALLHHFTSLSGSAVWIGAVCNFLTITYSILSDLLTFQAAFGAKVWLSN
jgi:hypothetical protein